MIGFRGTLRIAQLTETENEFSTLAVPLIGLVPIICVSNHHLCDSQAHRKIQAALHEPC